MGNHVGNLIPHYIEKNFMKGFYLQIRIGMQIQFLRPWEIFHAPLNGFRVCPIIVPYFPLNWERGSYFEVYFAVNYLVITF